MMKRLDVAWLVNEIFAKMITSSFFLLLKDQNEQLQESEMDRHHPLDFRCVASASTVQSTVAVTAELGEREGKKRLPATVYKPGAAALPAWHTVASLAQSRAR